MPVPLRTLTYEPTLDDHVGAMMAIAAADLRPWRTFTFKLFFNLLLGGAMCYFFVDRGLTVWAWWVGFMVFALSSISFATTLGMRKVVAKRLRGIYEQKKNIGLAVPTTVSLYDRYLETSSVLERTQVAWDVVEAVSRRDGYVLITFGMSSVFLPERVFEDGRAFTAFVELAESLRAAALARPGDLTASSWEG